MSDGSPAPNVSINLLGPLELRVGGAVVAVPGRLRRMLLAAFAIAPRRVLRTEQLIDLAWPDEPPQDAIQALYSHVSRLRGHLGDAGGQLTKHQAGYCLDVPDGALDVARATTAALELSGRPAAARAGIARAALELWAGPALMEFRDDPYFGPTALALDDLRLRLQEDLLQARLDVGEAGVVADAAAIGRTHPFRERIAVLLVRALAHEGRAAEAMRAAAAYRARLVREAGLDPSPAFTALEQQVAGGGFALGRSGPGESASRRMRLAHPGGPFVGRERERDEVLRLLDGHRVVTLTGVGGVGKTRLALDVAAELGRNADVEVAVVDLAAVAVTSRVAQAMATSLRLRTGQEVTAEDVADAAADHRLVLVLDNCEHVVNACRQLVDTITARASGVRLLCTSRVTLQARGEYVVRLRPLPVPTAAVGLESTERQPSIRAFLEHARRADSSFALDASDLAPLVELLQRLDGLPLAIEIAAGYAGTLSVPALRDRLFLDLAGTPTDANDRHATLRAAIGWSYDMLPAPERALLLAMAPYPAGVDLGTVELLARETIPGADPVRSLRRLLDASLLDVETDRTRYRLLFTVRSFLLDDLDRTGGRAEAEARFTQWAAVTARQLGNDLTGPAERAADHRLRREIDNLRAARDLCRARDDLDTLVEITLAVDRPAIWRDLREMWVWCLELADDTTLEGHPCAVEILGAAAEAARLLGDYDRATALARRGLALTGRGPDAWDRCESALAGVALYRGDFTEAARRWRRAGRTRSVMQSAYLASAALAAAYAGKIEESRQLLTEATDHAGGGGCASNRAFASYVAGEITAIDDQGAAIPAYEEAIGAARSVGATFVEGIAAVALASARTRLGDRSAAAAAYAELLGIWQETGQAPQLWTTARNAAVLLAAEGRVREAALLSTRADAAPGASATPHEHGLDPRHHAEEYLIDADELDALRRQALAMPVKELVDEATAALRAIAALPA